MDIFLKSLASGVAVGIILTILKFFGEKVAGIFAGIPLVFALSFALLAIEKPEKMVLHNFLWGGYFPFFRLCFFTEFYIFLPEKVPKNGR